MIEMSNVQPQVKFRSERVQRVKQAQRIDPARDADDDRRAGRQQIVFGDEAAKTRQEIHLVVDYNDNKTAPQLSSRARVERRIKSIIAERVL